MHSYVFKPEYTPPEGPAVIVDAKQTKGIVRGNILDTLEDRIQEAQEELSRLQVEVNAANIKYRNLRESIIEEANYEREKIIEDAQREAEVIILQSEKVKEEIFNQSKVEGLKEGQDEGFKIGEEEAARLIHQMKEIITNAEHKRENIVKRAEEDIIEMAILIAKKIVKSELKMDKEIVIKNVQEALKKVSERDEITIRVNFSDLKLTEAHKEEFLKDVSGVKKVNIKDDSTIEIGGCKIETDFGSVDAEIGTQIEEIKKSLREAIEELGEKEEE
ncbi:MAG: FliH/SctL family protein [bacterium]|nr:FliH/SctL family protein [bacterium]